jgi:5-deoxy-glucuronate isomerase
MIHPSAPPNYLAPDELRVRPAADGVTLAIDPQRAGWRYLSFRVIAADANERVDVGGSGTETCVVLLSGGGAVVDLDSDHYELTGRATVFDGKPWACYLPDGCHGYLSARPVGGARYVVVGIAEAPSSGREGVASKPVLIRPDDVEVEIRGAGDATRRIHHIIKPEFPADRLEIVEVYTPAGNWSSWPPHKHDTDDLPREAYLEETYYHRLRRPKGFGVQRVYTPDRSLDAVLRVGDGDVVLVPRGYHPVAAAPGCDLWYLNVMAGPVRRWAVSVDPVHGETL